MAGGMIEFSLMDNLPFIGTGLFNYIFFFAVTVLIFTSLNFLNQTRFYQFTLIVFSLVIIAASGVSPFIVLIITFLSFIGVGRKVRQLLFHHPGSDVIDLLLGAGILGTFIGILVHFPVNYRFVYIVILLVPIVLLKNDLTEMCSRWNNALLAGRHIRKTDRAMEIIIASLAMVYIAAGLMPEVGHDALAMHLVQPMYVAEHHFWPFDVSWHLMAVIPMLGNWLCTLVYLLAGETGAKLLVTGFLFVSAFLIAKFTSQHWGRTSALAAILCFLSCPVAFQVGNSLMIEVFWMSFLLGAVFLLLDAAKETAKENPLVICGVLIGFAVSCKLIPLLIMPAIFIGILFNWKGFLPLIKARCVVLGITGFILAAVQSYLVAWLKTGNPVFPFFNAVFQSPFYLISNFDNPEFHQGIGLDTLYLTVFESQKYLEASMGAPGFTWLLLLPMAVYAVLVKKDHRLMVLGIIGLGFTAIVFHFQSYLRYIIPVFAMFSVLIAAGSRYAANFSTVLRGMVIVLFGGSILLNILFLPSAGWRHRDFPIQILLGDPERSNYIVRQIPQRAAIDFVNTLPSAGGTVAVIGRPFIAGLKTDRIMLANQYNEKFWGALRGVTDSLQMLQTLKSFNIETLIVSDHISDDPNVTAAVKKRVKTLLLAITDSMVTYSDVSVRKIRKDLLFMDDILKNGSLDNTDGFYLFEGAEYLSESKGLRVSVQSPAIQNVDVKPNQRYRLKALIMCDREPASARLQINWLDQSGTFIKTNIKVVPCDPVKVQSMDVLAPQKAKTAVIYAAGHTDKPVVFKRLWFLSN